VSIKPIPFNTEMVKAILDGRKTQTRRVVKGIEGLNVYRAEPAEDAYETLHQWDFFYGWSENGALYDAIQSVKAPYAPGDILWVREKWMCIHGEYKYSAYSDASNSKAYEVRWMDCDCKMPWRPSIHMPKEAARIFLRVKNLRVERLQDMSEDDAFAEGAGPFITCDHEHPLIDSTGAYYDMCYNDTPCLHCPIDRSYGELFGELVYNPTVKKKDLPLYGWDANPWVWVIEFERCKKPEGWPTCR